MKKNFLESLDTAVITTKYILDGKSPVLYVFHYNSDGAWSFSGSENSQEGDYRVVSLEEIINIDNSVLEIADMPYGYCAKRGDKYSPWIIAPFDES